MTLTFRPAKRENVPLLIGLAGGTGAGKTYSAMALATGMAGGKPFAVLDTENGRAKHYADLFRFDVADLTAPFRPERYAEAIEAADAANYPVIVVDSMTHEWDGDGGCLDWQEQEYARLGGHEAVKLLSWQAPKRGHRKMLTRLLQVRAHVILCFRAAERVEFAKDDKGKTVVRPKRTLTGLDGWVPISEPRLPYELTLSILLTADAPGLPKPIKLQASHRPLVPLDAPLTAEVGAALAAWARGSGGGEEAAKPTPRAATPDGAASAPEQAETAAFVKPSAADRKRLRALAAKLIDAGLITPKQVQTAAQASREWPDFLDDLSADKVLELLGRLERYEANKAAA